MPTAGRRLSSSFQHSARSYPEWPATRPAALDRPIKGCSRPLRESVCLLQSIKPCDFNDSNSYFVEKIFQPGLFGGKLLHDNAPQTGRLNEKSKRFSCNFRQQPSPFGPDLVTGRIPDEDRKSVV